MRLAAVCGITLLGFVLASPASAEREFRVDVLVCTCQNRLIQQSSAGAVECGCPGHPGSACGERHVRKGSFFMTTDTDPSEPRQGDTAWTLRVRVDLEYWDTTAFTLASMTGNWRRVPATKARVIGRRFRWVDRPHCRRGCNPNEIADRCPVCGEPTEMRAGWVPAGTDATAQGEAGQNTYVLEIDPPPAGSTVLRLIVTSPLEVVDGGDIPEPTTIEATVYVDIPVQVRR